MTCPSISWFKTKYPKQEKIVKIIFGIFFGGMWLRFGYLGLNQKIEGQVMYTFSESPSEYIDHKRQYIHKLLTDSLGTCNPVDKPGY